jgi:hypothetical protein
MFWFTGFCIIDSTFTPGNILTISSATSRANTKRKNFNVRIYRLRLILRVEEDDDQRSAHVVKQIEAREKILILASAC